MYTSIRDGRTMHLVLLRSHGTPVIAVRIQVVVELDVLLGDGVLADMRQAEKRQGCTEDTQRAGNEKGILPSASGVWCVILDDWEDVAADKSSDLAYRSGNAVVLSSNASSTGL
jgi:hypothetical protein